MSNNVPDDVKGEIGTLVKMEKEINKFFKVAFCIDGEVTLMNPDKFEIESAMKLTDSKRGTFYIGSLKAKVSDV